MNKTRYCWNCCVDSTHTLGGLPRVTFARGGFTSLAYDLSLFSQMAMLQQQRRGEDRLAGTDTVGVASSDSYVLSHSIASRRAMLAQSYYDDAKRYASCFN